MNRKHDTNTDTDTTGQAFKFRPDTKDTKNTDTDTDTTGQAVDAGRTTRTRNQP